LRAIPCFRTTRCPGALDQGTDSMLTDGVQHTHLQSCWLHRAHDVVCKQFVCTWLRVASNCRPIIPNAALATSRSIYVHQDTPFVLRYVTWTIRSHASLSLPLYVRPERGWTGHKPSLTTVVPQRAELAPNTS
jgi:hypothetical protein